MSKVSDQQLIGVAPACANLRQLLLAAGLSPRGGNYGVYRARLRRLGVTDQRFHARAPSPGVTADDLFAAVAASRRIAEVAERLPGGGSVGHRRVRRLLLLHPTDTSHVLGRASNRGAR